MTGPNTIREVLERAVKNGRLAHAYLFVGPLEAPMAATARWLISLVVGGALETHPDVMIVRRDVDAETEKLASSIGVEVMRDVCERFAMTALSGRKALFIEEADRLNSAAANALLKTLEEPRGDALIILCADSEESVPRTIASRCQIIRFHAATPSASAEAVEQFDEIRRGSIASRLRFASESLPKEEANKTATLELFLNDWELLAHDKLRASVTQSDLTATQRWASALRTIRSTRRELAHNVNPQLAIERVLLSL